VTLAVAWRGLQGEWIGGTGGRFDVTGSVLYGATLIAVMLGLSALPSRTGVLLALAGLALAAVFVLWERRVAHPVLDLTLLTGNPVFGWSNLAALINYSASYAATFLVSLYLQYLRGLDPAQAGLILLTPFVLMAVMSPVAGWLSDRLEPRWVASAGMALTVAGLGWFCFVEAETPLGWIQVPLVIFGVGFGLFSSPNTNAVMSAVDKSAYGVAAATLGTMRLLGQMVSMGLAAAVLGSFVGRAAVTPSLYPRFIDAMHAAFALFAALCTVGVFASLARGRIRAGA
jgi:MFS family permease